MNHIKTKLYATLGPACTKEPILQQMLELGVSGFRLNLSHMGLSECKDILNLVKHASQQSGTAPEILIDMQGPEMRIGVLPKPLECKIGKQICLYNGQNPPSPLNSGTIPVGQQILDKFSVGQNVMLDDGKIRLKITEIAPQAVIADVKQGGMLSSRKSIAIDGFLSDLPALTESDLENISLAKQFGVTGLMQPFVRNGEDLLRVRNAMSKENVSLHLFAKIENLDGIRNLETIIPNADEIIIARGDLGNAMPLWELPAWQRKIGDLCKKRGKSFMIVTQMLSSMEQNPFPTRAEVNDIFHAVLDGASSVMVTGETAIGKYPLEVIRYLANTCREAELFMQNL